MLTRKLAFINAVKLDYFLLHQSTMGVRKKGQEDHYSLHVIDQQE
jgi:hypothetical protein